LSPTILFFQPSAHRGNISIRPVWQPEIGLRTTGFCSWYLILLTHLISGLLFTLTVTMDSTSVGIIGMGDMGRMYAKRISEAGWK
jgi:hypothetical protein